MTDTAMKAAFMAAGYRTTEQKLNELMRQAIFAGRGKHEPSCDAFVVALTKEPEPAPLLWLLFEAARAQCIGRLFTAVLQQMRAEGAFKPAADPVEDPMPQGQDKTAASAAGSTAADPPPRAATRPKLTAVERVASSLVLDTKRVAGVTARSAKVSDARAWGKGSELEGRFWRILLADVPDEGLVGDHVSDAQAEQAWELAQSAQNADP